MWLQPLIQCTLTCRSNSPNISSDNLKPKQSIGLFLSISEVLLVSIFFNYCSKWAYIVQSRFQRHCIWTSWYLWVVPRGDIELTMDLVPPKIYNFVASQSSLTQKINPTNGECVRFTIFPEFLQLRMKVRSTPCSMSCKERSKLDSFIIVVFLSGLRCGII